LSSGVIQSAFTHPLDNHPMSRSEIGDTFEALFQRHGAPLLVRHFGGDYREVAHAGGTGARTTPLDFMLDHSHGGELKTMSAHTQRHKTAINAQALARKEAALSEHGLSPLLVVQVVDMGTGRVEVYGYPAFASVSKSSMQHLGSYEFSMSDFQQAQQVSGYWEKAVRRAERGSARAS
jgi:hypothetical protein